MQDSVSFVVNSKLEEVVEANTIIIINTLIAIIAAALVATWLTKSTSAKRISTTITTKKDSSHNLSATATKQETPQSSVA